MKKLSTALALSLAIAGMARAEAIVDGNKVTFRLDARQWGEKPKKLNVVGSFQGWSTDATPMRDADGDGIWEATLEMTGEGGQTYKFYVDGSRWLTDPTGDVALEVDDNYGGKNSGLVVGFDARKAPPPKPNHVNGDAVKHDPKDVRDADAFEGQWRLRIRAQPGDVQSVNAIIDGKSHALSRMGSDGGLDAFAGVVPAGKSPYAFELVDGTGKFVLNALPTMSPKQVIDTPDWAKSAVWYQIFPERFRNGDPSNDPADGPNDRLVGWKGEWFKPQPGETPGDENFYEGDGNVWKRKYGGDLQGVKQSLPYLKSLGINAIYFNPIFEAESMHKYDTADFRHVDDNFGVRGDLANLSGETDDPKTWQFTPSDKVLLDFIDAAHEQGFKVVLDGVFNHVGRAHPFFQDVLANGKRSKYASWFEITDFGEPKNWRKLDDPYSVHGKPGGVQWKAWDKENGHLPVFKKDDKLGLARGPREHIMAITKRWLAPGGDAARGIDGWRLDVPGDIPHPFWRDWRKLVKQTKPDAYITGEIWPWAQAWLNAGDQFDAVMNYQFAMPAQEFFVNEKSQMKPSAFSARLAQVQMAYPQDVSLAQQNLFDSHDTDRLASMFVNPDRPYDGANRPQDNAKERGYSAAKPTPEQWERLKQALSVQFAYVGAPMIYYGTEAGMWSPDDPSNRQPMIWKDLLPYADPSIEFNADVFAHVQRLAAVRTKLDALRDGFYVPLMADDERNVFAFKRTLAGKPTVYIAVNRSATEQKVEVALDGPVVNWLDANEATVEEVGGRPTIKATARPATSTSITLKPFGTAILSAP